jgi:soluble lytic murein transglycosylase
VVSPAQAIGLMQMIPPTAQEVANSMHRRHFMSDELFQPSVNIEFGTQYLATNLQRFGQNLIKTIASYNAGEQAVERWNRVHSDLEWDEFVEEIPYSETQDYVRKVLKSFYIYQLLYF